MVPAGVVPAEALPRAVALHEAGRLADADALYAAILDADPRNADALHLRGLIACQTGRFEVAADLIGRAIRAGGRVADHHANHAYALQALGRWAEAEAAARRALRLNPALPEAANTLGNALTLQGRHEEALRAYREALRRRPGYAEAEGNLGIALQALGRAVEAEPHLRRALAASPGMAEAELALGNALLALQRADEAVPLLRDAVRRRPAHAPAWAALARTGGARTVERWRRALALAPADAEAWNAAGLAFQAQDRLADAGRAFVRALATEPGTIDALTNLGSLRRLQARPAEAADLQRAALARRPRDATARTNLALALQDQGAEAEAESQFTRALKDDPTQALARFNRGVLRLMQGRLEEGWADYDARFESSQLFAPRRIALPPWAGDDLTGRRILVWREQGLGDELMFSSCYPDLIARAGGVVLECDRRLVPLFARSFPGTIVRAPTADPRDADVQAPAGSLPRHLRPRIAAFRRAGGWLIPDPDRVRPLRARVAALGPGLKVGIAWTSRRADTARRAAYTSLDEWAPLFGLAGIQLVSLQYDGRDDDVVAAERRSGVRIHRIADLDLMNDLDGAAALTSTLDLVLTVASSVGEMAGALGVPTWRLGGRDWTQLGTPARPWFPAQRVIRPVAGTGMAGAVARAAALLESLTR
ncbi:tetratricopeptide repeat protein [Azospirillum sp. RWY-5-1]|uniref:Tetratricopeptide repeat protein n=1 Tax=Azospirillum oleiclasticum TaxID=2735135 RepID=A0ABX2THF0_9PROT|nr:tetratricopeptide repeat protein [Azospirillum oleiclasticum]NYZ22444.1 tetratricopeptide repeat protein [Azospirillum oleiclasticum]